MSNTRLISGRVLKKTGNDLEQSRYQFLDLASAEPDLGTPNFDGAMLISDADGTRYWTDEIRIDLTGNIAVGTISNSDGSSAIRLVDNVLMEDNLVVNGLTTAPDLFTSRISSPDSSAITVTPAVILNSDLSVDGDAVITGNFTVMGTTTTINSTQLSVEDKNIELANGAGTAAEADGAGITVNGPAVAASLIYTASDDTWNFNKTLKSNVVGDVTGDITGRVFTTEIDSPDSSSITFTPSVIFSSDITVENDIFGNVTGQVSDITNHSIGQLSDVDLAISPLDNQTLVWDAELTKFVPGDSFSQADFDTAFISKSIGDLSDVDITTVAPTDGQTLIWNSSDSKFIPGRSLGVADNVEFSSITADIFTNSIDSADSTEITFIPAVRMSSDLTVENDLTVSNEVSAEKFVGYLDGTARDIDNTSITNKQFAAELDGELDQIFVYDASAGELKKTYLSSIVSIGTDGAAGSQGFTGSTGEIGFTGSRGIGLDEWIKITANYAAASGNRIIADTTAGSFAITLPPNPVLGSFIVLTDGGNWSLNPLTISAGGASIEGYTEDVLVDIGGVTTELLWDGSMWQITATLGAAGNPGPGVPDGGTTGQILSKVSDDDYDTAWSDPSSELDLSAVAQDIIPSANVTYDIGSTSLRFRDIYLANSTIHLGSQQISADGSGLNLPSSVSIGNVTLDTSSGNLSLPAGSRIDGAAVATPRISSIDYPGDDTAADTAGGQTLGIVGSGFVSGASVILDGTSLGTVTVVSSTRIEITAPAKSAGSYTLYVINSDGGTGIFIPGVQYSGLPTWSSPAAGSLGTVYETANVTATFSATSDSSVTYSLLSGDLPAGTSLDSSTGVLSGTADLIIGSSVTYSFTIRATDAENQDTDRAFSLTIDADSVTWSSPTDGDTISVPVDTASTTTLSAASAAGDSITYSANTLPSGLTLSGDTITGTANTVANTSVALTATADTTARSATVIVTFSVIQISDYIATPTATPAAFGDALEGGFYTGLIWNQVTQSDTSTTIATGSKTFTVTDDMAATPLFYGGQEVEVRSRANPDTARMIGTVTNAQGTTLTVNVTSVDGSGTLTDWSIMAKYRIIVSPKSSGENDYKPYKSSSTAAPAACGTLTEGLKATLAMVAAGSSAVYPAAHFCNDLSIGGYSDWYLPARDELELIWRNLKPVTDNNVTTANRLTGATPDYKNLGSLGDVANTHGLNNNSYPQGAAYTAAVPGQTSAVAFQTGGAEAMAFGSGRYYRSSTEYSDSNAWIHFYRSGSTAGSQIATIKTPEYYVRAVRRSII